MIYDKDNLKSNLIDRGKSGKSAFELLKIFALDQSLPLFQKKQTCLNASLSDCFF